MANAKMATVQLGGRGWNLTSPITTSRTRLELNQDVVICNGPSSTNPANRNIRSKTKIVVEMGGKETGGTNARRNSRQLPMTLAIFSSPSLVKNWLKDSTWLYNDNKLTVEDKVDGLSSEEAFLQTSHLPHTYF